MLERMRFQNFNTSASCRRWNLEQFCFQQYQRSNSWMIRWAKADIYCLKKLYFLIVVFRRSFALLHASIKLFNGKKALYSLSHKHIMKGSILDTRLLLWSIILTAQGFGDRNPLQTSTLAPVFLGECPIHLTSSCFVKPRATYSCSEAFILKIIGKSG